jgi:hypothetical protein
VWRVERTIPGVDATRDELLPYAGPAASLPLWSVLARLSFNAARAVWIVVLAVSVAALAAGCVALAGLRLSLANAGTAVLFCALSGPAISAVALGQAALVAAAAVALALLALDRRSPAAVVAAFVAGIQPNLALPLAVRLNDRRSAAFLALAAVIFLGVTFAAGGGPAGFVAYLARLAAHGAAERFTAIQYGVPAIGASFGLSAAAANAVANACAVLAIGLAVAAAVRLRAQPLLAMCVAIALLPWVVPFFHEHDFTLDLIPVLVLAAAPAARTRAFAAVAAACTLVDWFGVAQRPGTALETACLAGALACAFSALPARAAGAAPAAAFGATVLLAAAALPLALAFPAPVWPDTLGPFHAAATLDASAVWAAEQLRAGLDTGVPAWGVLRAIPLAGCALLAFAAYDAARAGGLSPPTVDPR